MLFFFSQAGAVHDPDADGVEFPTMSQARIEAVRFAASMLRDRPELAWLGDEYRVEVTDQSQRVLFTFIAVGVDGPAAKDVV